MLNVAEAKRQIHSAYSILHLLSYAISGVPWHLKLQVTYSMNLGSRLHLAQGIAIAVQHSV